MIKTCTFVLSLIFATAVFAQQKTNIVKSSVTFHIKNLGINTSGSFSGLKAEINFDKDHMESIEASVDAASVNTDNNMRDEHLKSDSYFDVEHFPKIEMKSVSFKHKSGDNYTGQFNVIIKGKTKILTVPFTYTETGDAAVFKGSFKLNRIDFGVGGKSMILSDEATVFIELDTSK